MRKYLRYSHLIFLTPPIRLIYELHFPQNPEKKLFEMFMLYVVALKSMKAIRPLKKWIEYYSVNPESCLTCKDCPIAIPVSCRFHLRSRK